MLANQAELAERRQKDLYLDIDTRLRKLEQAQEQAAAAAATQKPAAPGEPQEASAAETKAYQAALDQFKLGNYALAVAAMQNFLVAHPQSTLAPNAQYWVGMAHSGQRDYKSAIAAQRKLLATWPESQKAPDALLNRLASGGVLALAILAVPAPAADLVQQADQLVHYLRLEQQADGSFKLPGDDRRVHEEMIRHSTGWGLEAIARSHVVRPEP